MPSHPNGHEITGFNQACVVKATWIENVPQSEVFDRPLKRAPATIFKQVINWLKDKERDRKASLHEPLA
jgi:hypothetical protein